MLRNKQLRLESGFGIVEVVITIVLLGALSLAITGMFRSILYIQSAGQYQKSATLAAQREIESLRNSNYNDLTAGSTVTFTSELPTELPSPKSGTVSVSEPVSGLKRVDVTISYHKPGGTKQVKVSSTIGIIGITQ
jgi:Tfp pilus assembly protein PilV